LLKLTIITVPLQQCGNYVARRRSCPGARADGTVSSSCPIVEASLDDLALISPKDVPVPESELETQSIQESLVISTPVVDITPDDVVSIQHEPGVLPVPVVDGVVHNDEEPVPLEGIPEPELEPSLIAILIVRHPIPEDAVLQESE
jgi:hypothetical protein